MSMETKDKPFPSELEKDYVENKRRVLNIVIYMGMHRKSRF